MKITHLSNTFFFVEAGRTKICCDPWVGSGHHGGLHSFPEYRRTDLIDFVGPTDAVYISHIHSDHLDPRFLNDSGLARKEFIIRKFADRALFNRLAALGPARIIELEDFAAYKYGDIELTMIPQFQSNSSGLPDDVRYDMDTSMIFHADGITFFNQVDNPINLPNYRRIGAYIEDRYGRLTVACLMSGAASEYPECFLGIDRRAEQNRIIESSRRDLTARLEILRPKIYFPAGGFFFVPGKFWPLNEYIGQPSFDVLKSAVDASGLDVKAIWHYGARPMTLTKDGGFRIDDAPVVSPTSDSIRQSIENHRDDLYEHQAEPENPTDEALGRLFERAKTNWTARMSKANIGLTQEIRFLLYQDLRFDDDFKVSGSPLGEYRLPSKRSAEKGILTIHMDRSAFARCLMRKSNWNQVLSAPLCLFDRRPNVYYPTDKSSLNFLVSGER